LTPAPSSDPSTPVWAILFIITATLTFTALDTSVKLLVTEGISPIFIAWVRFFVHVVAVVVFLRAWSNARVVRWRNPWMQLIRGSCVMLSSIFTYFALQTLQLAEMTAIFFFGPMLVTALAGPLLGEWAGWRRWMAVIAGFLGVLIVVRPGFGGFVAGQLFAAGAMCSYSVYVILTRRLSATETSDSLIFYSGLIPLFLMLPLQPFNATMPSQAYQWGLLVLTGLVGALGHWLTISAYRVARPSAVAPYTYLQIVWSFIMGYAVFSQLPDMWTFVGSAIIVASGLYILHRERLLRLAERSAPNAEVAPLAEKL